LTSYRDRARVTVPVDHAAAIPGPRLHDDRGFDDEARITHCLTVKVDRDAGEH
jgi:hypothetical protein